MGQTSTERRHDIEKYCADTEIWGLNNGYMKFPQLQGKWARFFELHNYNYLKTWDPGQNVDHFRTLDSLNCDIYTTEVLPIIKKQKNFDILSYSRHFNTNYFLGSPSLMLMQALYEHDKGNKIEYIQSWGIDTNDPQHGQQRHSWAFWLRGFLERGIDIGGTATNFFAEYENDDGLRGLRENIGNILAKEQIKQE